MASEVWESVPGSPGYPEGLKDLEQPPRLRVLGSLGQAPAVAVVGTRRCTRYGLGHAEAIGAALGSAGWTVLSGLARGIDAAAHRGCLDAAGHAVAVLGTGLDVWYPAENRDLYRRILDSKGALVSEYPDGTRPDRWRFPQRNRLIAAISSAVVVVEAHVRGGALITARLGGEIGRPLFALPGDVDREASVGCNLLVRDGAIPFLGAGDLIEALSLVLGEPPRPSGPEAGEDWVAVAALPEVWACDPVEALIRLGRLEAAGKVERRGDLVRLGAVDS